MGPNQLNVLHQADSGRIRTELTSLARNWSRQRWLSKRNRYAINCAEKLEIDITPPARIRHGQLRRYIAASCAIHCMDGWSYIARAIEAHMVGDMDASRHLGYYAELRAAMSLLACAGVGVFDRHHFVVPLRGECRRINGSTHTFVWEALEDWAGQSSARDLIFRVIRPGGIPLFEWLQHFPGATGPGIRSVMAKQWLLEWGLDLQRLASDREARNVSSYRPTSIVARRRQDIFHSLDFVEHFWKVNEPSDGFPFKSIDRHLLRQSLASVFKATHASGFHPRRVPAQFAKSVNHLLHAVTPGDLSENKWKEFLNFRLCARNARLLEHSKGQAPIHDPDHHIQVLARATLLLRVSTGASGDLLQTLPPTDLGCLSFWWHPIGEDRGFWERGAVPARLVDLWTDVQEALSNLKAYRNRGHLSRKVLFSNVAGAIRVLGSCERIGLWGLGL